MSGSDQNVVEFHYSVWQSLYPTLAWVTQGQAEFYFAQATIYCDNSPASRIRNLDTRAMIIGLLTAHIATLFGPQRDGIVGRITSASEGSVSVAVEMPGASASSAWFNQTAFGAAAYQAMAAFRSGGRYTPGMTSRMGYGRGYGGF